MSLRFGGETWLVLSIAPLVLYKALTMQEEWDSSALPPANVLATTYVGLFGILHLVASHGPHAETASYGSWVAVTTVTLLACWYQVPHFLLVETTTLFHFVGHLVILGVCLPHKMSLTLVAGATTLMVSYASPQYSLMDDASWILGWTAAVALFHHCELHLATHKPPLERMFLHAGYGFLLGTFVYFMVTDTTTIVKEPTHMMQGVLKMISANCFVILGFMAGGAFQPAHKTHRTAAAPNTPMAATLLDLSGTAIAVTNTNLEIRLFSQAFRTVVDPHHEQELQSVSLSQCMALSVADADRLQQCVNDSSVENVFGIHGKLVRVELSVMEMVEPENRGYVVILKPVAQQQGNGTPTEQRHENGASTRDADR